ncbi:hypothetical protein QAD02_015841 [Eretmocerus hayati]|uniref:Uncharacterized protein n=1 Tax=Eretmocerus hayati TaxID=131215 RepID=A0ACC2P9T9_9HYME|nr:hypothetical protein QAD02_015841 [Eretmocerus hayati]
MSRSQKRKISEDIPIVLRPTKKAKQDKNKEERERLKKAQEAMNSRITELIGESSILNPDEESDRVSEASYSFDQRTSKKNSATATRQYRPKHKVSENNGMCANNSRTNQVTCSTVLEPSCPIATADGSRDSMRHEPQTRDRNARNAQNVTPNNATAGARGNPQLFGMNHPEPMYAISNNIFCKTRILRNAINKSANQGQCCRKMLTGVFTLEAMLRCSLTGKTYHRREENDPQTSKTLHGPAIRAIIDFSRSQVQFQAKWKDMSTQQLKSAMRRKINLVNSEYRSARVHNRTYSYGDY